MLSDKNKKQVEKNMKNVEVVKGKRKKAEPNIPDQEGSSVDKLKKKYMNEGSDNKADRLKKKFLSDPVKKAGKATADSGVEANDDNDIEVGLVKKKNQDAATDAVDERTIVISNKDGMLGAQG
jgi:hypothetical protein